MESHRASKLDASGTAKAVVSSFRKLGVSYDVRRVHCFPFFSILYINFLFLNLSLLLISFLPNCVTFFVQIIKYRDPMKQLEMIGVPEEHLGSHAFHFYCLTSPDDSYLSLSLSLYPYTDPFI